MTPGRAASWLPALAVLLAALVPLSATDPPEAPTALTNEDVVRMVADGAPEADVVAAIKAGPCDFDVSEEMLDELRIAGVPVAVITAMKLRVAQSTPQPPPPETPRTDTARLVITFSALGAHTLRAPAHADEELKHRLRLSKDLAALEIHDVAVFVACTTAEHVPDLWRQKTPLGRDMNLGMRHEMLVFLPGNTPAGKKPKLSLPERIEADVDDSEPHDLVLGVAALIGDRWMQVSAGTLADTKVTADSKPLLARISALPGALNYTVTLAAPSQ